MFGGGGGFGSNNNTGGGMFGQTTSTFGQNNNAQAPAFGQQQPTSTFGQPAQQNTGGIFGQSNNTQNTGFSFGQNTQQQPQQNNAFGGARPGFGATGGSTFGQTNTNTGGGMFGSTNTTFGQNNNNATGGGLFGAARPAQQNTGMGFGSGSTSNLFGAKPTTNTFGAPQNNNNLQPNQVQPYTGGPEWPPIPQTGSSNPQYFPTWQQDPNATGTGPSTAPPHLFHSISAMPPYRGASFEELRVMDYQQGRKDAGVQGAQAAGGFGTNSTGGFGTGSTGFGATANTGTSNAFGAGATTSPFGAPKPGGMFGSTGTTTGGFGSTSTNTGGGLFGQTNQQQPQSTFGATNTTGGGLFGSNNQQQPQQNATGGGLFGNTNPFGANNNQQQQQPASTGFSFGAKPATTGFGATPAAGTGAFGAAAPATGGFGQTNTTGSTGFGGFGQTQQNQQQQQPAATGGLFGGGGFGANTQQPAQNTTGGLFGSTTNNQQGSTGGLFGSTAPKPAGGLFGSTQPATGSTGFGGFGQAAAQPAAPASTGLGGGLFGGNNNTSTTNTGGLFGQQNQQQQQPAQPAATGGLFGGGNTSSLFGKPAAPAGQTGGLFGSTQPAQPAASTGGLFGGGGTQNTGGGLFGSTNTTQPAQGQQSTGGLFGGGSSLFGQQNQQQQQQPASTGTTGGLFGGGLGTSGGLFGGQQQQQPAQQNTGSSLFGGFGGGLGQSQNQQQQQPNLVASIDQNPYGSSPLFQTPGIQLQPVASTKKAALPPALNSSFRVTPNRSQMNKLRGFASPLAGSYSPARAGSVLGSPRVAPGSPRVVPGSPAMSDRYKGLSDMALSPHAFIPRENIKRLSIGNKGLGAVGSDDPEEALLGKSLLRKPATPAQNGSNEQQRPANGNLVFNAKPAEAASPRQSGSQQDVFASGSAAPAPVPIEKLKKGEYWCKPRLERLKQMTQAELRSVNNFVAGCKGRGEVSWTEPVDLTGLDLDTFLGDVIAFNPCELSVYCNGKDQKPPAGTGLNHPADVSLEGVFTLDRASKKPIRDEKDPRVTKFISRLKAVGNFVDYTLENGVWKFTVDHFSRWGVPDMSDEDDDGHWEWDEWQRRKMAASREKSVASGKSAESVDGMGEGDAVEDEEDDGEDEDEDFLPPTKGLHESESEADMTGDEDEESVSDEAGSAGDADIHAPPAGPGHKSITDRLGEDGARQVRAMQSDFFADRYGKKRALTQRETREATIAGLKNKLREKGFEFAEGEEEATHDDRAVKRASFGNDVESPRTQVQPRKYARVALKESTVYDKEGSKIDSGLALARSFRCSWGPNGELVHFGRICKPTAEFENSAKAEVTIEDVGLLAHDKSTENERAKRLLDLHLERTRVGVVDGVPIASLDEAIRFGDFTKLFEGGNRSHEANIWRLGVALFDEIDLRLPASADEQLVDRMSAIRRKLALSKWLENSVTPLVDHDLVAAATNAPLKVFTYLSGNQLERAVQAAIDAGDMRLATLVSQLGSPDAVREEVIRQLEDWHQHNNSSVLGDGYRRLYALFAGIMDVLPGNRSRGVDGCADVIISAGLDWKRAFGLRLWYGNPANHTVGEVLATYAQDLQAAHAPAKPLPAYLEKPAPLAKEWTMGSEPTDVLYGLIKLYSDVTVSLDDVLRARNCSPSPLDARLQWHLAMLLSQALRKRDFADRTEKGYSAQADSITAAYAAQLEETGEWTRAAFVLLHLQTVEGRLDAVKALLHRHSDSTDVERKFLLQRCRIPETWLFEAQAAAMASRDDAFGEFKALLRAELFDRAHLILKDKLAIEAILRGDDALLKRLCGMFEGSEPAEWDLGGQLFLDYIEIKVDLPTLYAQVLRAGPAASATDIAKVNHLTANISRLIQLLPALFPDVHDPRQAAALGDMLSTLAGLEVQLMSGSSGGAGGRGAGVGGGSKGRMVVGDRLAVLQGVAVREFERAVGVLA